MQLLWTGLLIATCFWVPVAMASSTTIHAALAMSTDGENKADIRNTMIGTVEFINNDLAILPNRPWI